jgi:L-threonylcarbamoyladenylate synthase
MEARILTAYNIDEQFDNSIIAASELFFSGKIFIYPTDTIYGIGGNPFNNNSVKRINDIKGREKAKQFIWLISDIENLLNYIEIDFEIQLEFLKKIWPGPVSVILKLNSRSKELVGYETAAIRIPDNIFCKKLLNEISLPLISTSVNKSGQKILNDIKEIKDVFNEDADALFYSNKKIMHIASTIIDLKREKPVLIREGAVKFVELLDKFN